MTEKLTKTQAKFLEIDKCTDLQHMIHVNLIEDMRRLLNRHPTTHTVIVQAAVILPNTVNQEAISTIYAEVKQGVWERINSTQYVEGGTE